MPALALITGILEMIPMVGPGASALIAGLVAIHDAAHGFRQGRSIVSNAAPHAAAEVVVNLDVEQFFPTITFRRIKGVFHSLGYSEQVATVLALLTSESTIQQVELDGVLYHVAGAERFLPQGAPSSPALTNIICRGLDARLARIAERELFGRIGATTPTLERITQGPNHTLVVKFKGVNMGSPGSMAMGGMGGMMSVPVSPQGLDPTSVLPQKKRN